MITHSPHNTAAGVGIFCSLYHVATIREIYDIFYVSNYQLIRKYLTDETWLRWPLFWRSIYIFFCCSTRKKIIQSFKIFEHLQSDSQEGVKLIICNVYTGFGHICKNWMLKTENQITITIWLKIIPKGAAYRHRALKIPWALLISHSDEERWENLKQGHKFSRSPLPILKVIFGCDPLKCQNFDIVFNLQVFKVIE